MTTDDAKAWLARFGDLPYDLRPVCQYGHAECSITPQGACLDDVLKAAIPPEE